MTEKKDEKIDELGPHNAGFDFRLPYHVGRFQALNADLSFQGSTRLADPRDFITGAAVVTLHPDGLSHGLDARRRYQTRSCG